MNSLIIDTDFETDCDDAGALAVACALADAGRIRLLGVNASVCSPWPAAADGAGEPVQIAGVVPGWVATGS